MKIVLILFVLLDFIFVGLILTLQPQTTRSVSSVSTNENAGLSEGQQNKWRLIQSFHFQKNSVSLEFETDQLQSICDTSSLVELRFIAQNQAFSGESPSISHVYSCYEIKKDLSKTNLSTSLDDFRLMHQQKKLQLQQSQLTSNHIYASEDFPTEWKLAEIKISGASTFTINQFEIEKVLQNSFVFQIPIFAE